jgi:hypothetical protein
MTCEPKLDEQALRLAEYLSRMGIRLAPGRAREAILHVLHGTGGATAAGPDETISPDKADEWAGTLGVTPDQLHDAMLAVGTHVQTVRRYLSTGLAFKRQ